MPYKRKTAPAPASHPPSEDLFATQDVGTVQESVVDKEVEDDAVPLEPTNDDPGRPRVITYEGEGEEEDEDDDGEVATASQAPPQNPGRRPAIKLILTEEQEDELAEWYKDNRIFYDKGRRDYKDANLKAQLLEQKAASLDAPITG